MLVKVPVFSGNAVAGQDHVGVIGRLGQEDLLHDQVLELGERLARVLDVGVGHRRVLAHDVHPRDRPAWIACHDLDDRQPALGIERRAPEVLEERARTAASSTER